MAETIQLILSIQLMGAGVFLLICNGVLMLVQAYKILKENYLQN